MTNSAAAETASTEKVVVYVGGALIDGTGAPLKSDTAIVMRGERIDAVVATASKWGADFDRNRQFLRGRRSIPGGAGRNGNPRSQVRNEPDGRDPIRHCDQRHEHAAGGRHGNDCPGKLANLVFLSANPLDDIAAMRKVTLTVKCGVRYPRNRYHPVTKTEVAGRLRYLD
jgi:hypothetical protein